MAEEEPESELAAARPFTWSDEDAVGYEVAQDTISRVIAECTARYWAERRKPNPDEAIVERWRAERLASVRASQSLRADDRDAVAAAITHFGRRLRELTSDR